MRSKKCNKHKKYLYNLVKKHFHSDLGLQDIAKKLNTDRHTVTGHFIRFFGKEETLKRNEETRRWLVSKAAVINFNPKSKYGKVTYYDSLNNGKVRFRSKLEKQFAEFLDESGVKWAYEYKAFPYIDKEGKRRTYTPDFYFVDEDRYIEIKGYCKSDDEYKINALKDIGINIIMIKRGEFEKAI